MSTIKQNVLLRVHTIRTLRPLVSDAAAGVVLFLVALYGIGHEVWVAKVVANMPPLFDVAAVTQFFLAAFMQTEFIVQTLTVLAVVAAILVIRRAVLSINLASASA
jgi:hypothetical protein